MGQPDVQYIGKERVWRDGGSDVGGSSTIQPAAMGALSRGRAGQHAERSYPARPGAGRRPCSAVPGMHNPPCMMKGCGCPTLGRGAPARAVRAPGVRGRARRSSPCRGSAPWAAGPRPAPSQPRRWQRARAAAGGGGGSGQRQPKEAVVSLRVTWGTYVILPALHHSGLFSGGWEDVLYRSVP